MRSTRSCASGYRLFLADFFLLAFLAFFFAAFFLPAFFLAAFFFTAFFLVAFFFPAFFFPAFFLAAFFFAAFFALAMHVTPFSLVDLLRFLAWRTCGPSVFSLEIGQDFQVLETNERNAS